MATKKQIEIETIIQPIIQESNSTQQELSEKIKQYGIAQTTAVTQAFQNEIDKIVDKQISILDKKIKTIQSTFEKMQLQKQINQLQNIKNSGYGSVTQGKIPIFNENLEFLLSRQKKDNSLVTSQSSLTQSLENQKKASLQFSSSFRGAKKLTEILNQREKEYQIVEKKVADLTQQLKEKFKDNTSYTLGDGIESSQYRKPKKQTNKKVQELLKDNLGDTVSETQFNMLTKSAIDKINLIFKNMTDSFEKIRLEAKSEESGEQEVKRLKQQIRESVVADVLRDFHTEQITVPGTNSKTSYYAEGKAKDESKSVLTSRNFRSFAVNGSFVPGTYIDENGKRHDNRTIAVKSDRLTNPDNLLGLGNLSNASITQLQQAYEKIGNIPNPSQKVIEFADEIVSSIVEAINNTEDGPIKQALINQLSGIMTESYEDSQDRFLSDLVEQKNTSPNFNKQGGFYDLIRSQAGISASTAPTAREVGSLETGEGQQKQESRNEAGALREHLNEVTKAAEQLAVAFPMIKGEIEALEEELTKLEKKNKISQEDMGKFAELLEVVIQHMMILKDERAESRLIEQGEKDKYGEAYKAPAYILDAPAFEDSHEAVMDRNFGEESEIDKDIDNTSIDENLESAIGATEDISLKAKETITALKQALDSLSNYVESDIGVTDTSKEKGIKAIGEFSKNLDGFDDELATKFEPAIGMIENAVSGDGSLTGILQFIERSNQLIQEMKTEAQKAESELVDIENNVQSSENQTTKLISSGTAKKSLISSQSIRGAEDDTIKFITTSLSGLLNRVKELKVEGANEVVQNSTGFTSRVENINHFYNTLANFLNYSDIVNTSLQQYADRLQGITEQEFKVEDLAQQFVKNNPEMGERYIQSLSAKNRFNDAGGIQNIDEALEAFFNSQDSLIIRYKQSWDKLVDEIVTISEDGIDDFSETGQSLVKRNLIYRLDPTRSSPNPNQYEGIQFYSKHGIQGQKIPQELFDKSSHSMRTQLAYRAGYTGARYGGYTPEEDLEKAKELLKQKQNEVKQVSEDEAWLLDAEIKLIKEDIKTLTSAVKEKTSQQAEQKDNRSAKSKRKAERKILAQQELQKRQTQLKQDSQQKIEQGLSQDNLIGSVITHKTLGKGTIISQENGIIKVKFEIDGESKSFVQKDLSKYIVDFEKAQQQEQQALEKTAEIASGEHTKGIESATEAEKNKIVVSKELADVLSKEADAHEEVTKASEEEVKAQDKLDNAVDNGRTDGIRWNGKLDSIEGFIPEYDDKTHTYRKKLVDGTYESVLSSTQGRDILLHGTNPVYSEGLNRLKKIANNGIVTAENPLTAEMVGMQNDLDQFNSMVNTIAVGLRGDLFHHLVDIMSKYEDSVESLEDLQNLAAQGNKKAEADLRVYNNLKEDTITQLSHLGINEDYLGIENRLASYMDAYKKAKDRFGISRTQFSERQLGMTLKGNRGKVNIGVTPDQVYSIIDEITSGRNGAIFDSKTGNVKGYEALQLTTQLMALIANLDNVIDTKSGATVRDLIGDADLEKVKLFIADVGENYTEFIEYMRLTDEEVYNAFMNVKEIMENGASPLTKQEANYRFNRQIPGSRIVGSSNNEIHNDADITLPHSGDRFDDPAIKSYISIYKQIERTKQDLIVLQEKLNVASDDEVDILEEQIKANQTLLGVLEDIQPELVNINNSKEPNKFDTENLLINGQQITRTNYRGAQIGNVILTENGADKFTEAMYKAKAELNKQDASNLPKISQAQSKAQLDLINQYIKAQKELLNLKKEEVEIKSKLEKIGERTDSNGELYDSLNRQLVLNNKAQNEQKRLSKEAVDKGLNVDDFTYTDAEGKNNSLTLKNRQALANGLLEIERQRIENERNLKEQENKQQESDLKQSQSRYLKLLKERHDTQLSILKLENQNEEINATTKDQAKIQENNVLLDQYKNQLAETSQEFEELENHLRTIDALNDDAFRIENNKFNNEQVKVNNSHSENLRKIESNNSKNQEKINDAQVKSYLNNLREQYKLERDIAIQQEHLKSVDGGQKKEVQAYIDILTRQRDALKASAPIYDQVNKTLNGQKLTTEQLITLEQGRTKEINNQEVQMAKIQANIRAQIPLLDQLIGSFKVAFQNVSLYNISQRGFNAIENAIRQIISSAKELDASLVDIQIASGMTKKETNQFMISLNQLGQELGMTTQQMASASNDWLRAGYQGREAMELTRASASLAQLGMIDTTDATSYLISSLKGWKLEASEVMNVVSKLTAVDMSAAISAGDLAEAMSRANSSAQLAGVSMDRYIGLLTVGADVTQRAPESIGQAWNTLFARLGNVKAGKFVASQEEMESDNYNADDFEALNDVEKVLDSVGIKLRENYGIWRDTEDVIDSIAKQWDNWDKTMQNAVATSIAGTRQREIFVTTMENYDQVSKYEQIAANSYGTAQEKMLAYTDSLEASQKRYQNALESFSLALNRTEILKVFYDTITFITKNFVGLGTAITTIIALTKGQDIAKFFTEGISSVGMRTVNFGQNLSRIKTDVDNQGLWTTFKGMFSDISSNLNQAYNEQLKERYATDLRKNYNTLTESQQNSMIGNQNAFLFNENGIDLSVAQNALKDFTNALQSENILDLNDEINNLKDAISYYQSQLEESEGLGEDITSPLEETLSDLQSQLGERQTVLEQQRQQALMEVATNEEYVGIKDQLISEHRQEYDALVQQYLTDVDENGQTRSLAEAERLATSQILESNLTEEELQRITRQLTTRRGELTAGQNMALGAITSGLGLVGTIGLGNFGQQFFGDNGQIVGSMVGGMLTTTAMSSISSAINNPEFRNSIVTAFKSGSLKGVLSGVSGALGSAGLWGAGIALIGTLVLAGVGLWKKHQKELIEAQAKEFQEESNKYQSMLSASIDASKFDKLSTGVDRLGRNVSLTDDEYEEFLNLNTKLAEQFPGLIKFTDGQGQAFIGAADGANSLSESIDSLIKQQKKLANEKLLAPELFGQTYKDAKKQYDEANKEYQNELKNSQYNLNDYSVSNKTNTEWLWGTDNLYGWHNRDYVQYIGGNEEINKQILKLAKSKGADSIKEINDQVLSDDGYSFNNVLIGIKVNPKDEAILKQSIEEIIGDSKSKLVELENNFEQSKHILDSEIQAIFENLSFNDTAFDINPEFDVEKFNKLSDEAKNVLRNAISGMQLTAKDGESFKFQVSDIIQQLIGQLDENDYNLIYKVGFEYDGESTYKEFIEARKQLYNIIQSLDIDDEIKKKILLSLEFTIDDTGNYSDNFDYVKRIRDEGLSKNFNFTDWYDTLSSNYSPDELKEIYSYLREINDLGIQISKQNLWDKFVVSKYTLSSTKELLNYFNQLENTTDALGQKRLNIVTDRIKELGKELGLASENLDYLNRAFNRMPEIDNLGIVTETPEKVSENFEDYSKIREYLNNDFNGTWDTDMLNLVMSKEDLAPFIGNIKELKKEVNSIPEEYEISYKRAIANAMGTSENGYQALLNMHSDLVQKMNDNYGIDLTQYKSLEQAKNEVNAQALILMQDSWKDYISNLAGMYAKDLEIFGNAQTKKLNMLGIVAQEMGIVDTNAKGTEYVTGKYYNAFRAGAEARKMYKNGATSEEINNAALNYAEKMMMKEWADKQIEGAKAEIDALMQGITIADIDIGKLGDKDSSSGSGNKFKEQLQNALDILKNYRNLIDKEWEAMLAWDEDKQIDYGTKYFEKMRENLSGQINATQAIIDELNSKGIKTDNKGNKTYWDIDSGEQITQKEFMSQINTYEADLIELQKELNNLDDEELQDNISLAEKKKEILDFEDERLGVYENYNRYLSKSEQSYRRQKENLEQQLWLAKELLKTPTDTEEEYYTNLQKVKELERKIADLEYEQQEHRINILESVDASVYTLIDAQKVLLENARTQEEMIEGQNKLNDLLEQERELRKSIFDFQRQNAERSNQYLSSTAYSNSNRYDNNYSLQVQSLESMKNIALENMEAEFRKAYKQYITELDEVTGQRKWTDEEAYTMAGQTEDYMSAYNEWFDLTQQIADLAVQKMEDKLAELDDMLDRAERVKPDDWSYYEQISEYTNEQLDILQKKKELLEDSLKDVSSWTDEQIKQATDNLNDTVEAINEALKNQKQEQIDYQDRQFDALISYLERMREEYNDLRDEVEEYYDALLKPLEQEIDDLDKINDLLQLQEALKAAGEKSRV